MVDTSKAPVPNSRRRKSSSTQANRLKALEALVDRLSGNEAITLTSRLIDEPAALEMIARTLSAGPAIENLRKLAFTSNIMESGRVEADYAYVGLPEEAASLDFGTAFREHMRPRLAKRAESFAVLFEALRDHPSPLIIETGCLRVPGNWDGDGQSTFQFDCFARDTGGSVITIDINPDSIDSARHACSGITSTILNDSVEALHMLSTRVAKSAALIYLDSFDLDLANLMPSAIHHATEMMAARGLIGPGTFICVDDFNVSPLGPGGKGLIVDQFLHTIRAHELYSGYQKIWQVPG